MHVVNRLAHLLVRVFEDGTATYGSSDCEQFGHDPVQESFATSWHAEIKIKVIRI